MNRLRGSLEESRASRVHPTLDSVESYFQMHHDVLSKLPYSDIERVADGLFGCYREGRTLFIFGNGGSAALASHFACDLGKGTLVKRAGAKRFRVIALTDNVPLMTAWANDSSYEEIFAEQLLGLMTPGDVVFAISGSGNSPNVLRALHAARVSKISTIGLTGFNGGKMRVLCDQCIVIPSENMQVIEDLHLSVSHALFTMLRHRIETF